VLFDALELPPDQRVPDVDAYRRRDEAAAAISANLSRRTTAECLAIFEPRGIWHAKVNSYSDVVTDPQVIYNKSFQVVEGATGAPVTLVSHPIRYDGEVPEVRLPPQKLGAQSDDILKELGYDAGQRQEFYAKGIVRTA
jgi:crotonobetainyl-CoA:carnitine CoA-transferase CaiB-like acyl-CoA transferase